MHAVSDFLDSIKESLTDAQYKEGMEICMNVFKQNKQKLYRMTYLRPYTFLDDHCDDPECHETKLCVTFTKVTGLVRLDDRAAESIRESNMFMGSLEDMKSFIDLGLLHSFPSDQEDLGIELQWYEFPVLKLEDLSVAEGQTGHSGLNA
jgi:hypothetical protein